MCACVCDRIFLLNVTTKNCYLVLPILTNLISYRSQRYRSRHYTKQFFKSLQRNNNQTPR